MKSTKKQIRDNILALTFKEIEDKIPGGNNLMPWNLVCLVRDSIFFKIRDIIKNL